MQSKKTNQLTIFSDILENKNSIFFISANNFTINDKTLLKSELNDIGLDLIVLKNGLFKKTIQNNFPKYLNLEPMIQGFCIAVYPSVNSENLNFDSLRSFALILIKKPFLLFLGGVHENQLVNKSFIETILSIKNPSDIYSELVSIIATPKYSLNNSLKQVPSKISTILKLREEKSK